MLNISGYFNLRLLLLGLLLEALIVVLALAFGRTESTSRRRLERNNDLVGHDYRRQYSVLVEEMVDCTRLSEVRASSEAALPSSELSRLLSRNLCLALLSREEALDDCELATSTAGHYCALHLRTTNQSHSFCAADHQSTQLNSAMLDNVLATIN